MKTFSFLMLILISIAAGNPTLDQDVIYLKASTVKLQNGETCEIIKEKDMKKAKSILHDYWKATIGDSTWANFNRQYMLYHSNEVGTVVMINGACLEKPSTFYENTWCLGMAVAKCYYSATVDLKQKKILDFKFNTYDK
ncbi:MAG: hypothetical protein JWP12_3304 [Bacteroidetes bacterium]|nr:hypothetical protein [Bacteroidota bacterium]